MKILGQVGTYIAGGPPARPKGGMPLRTTSCPLGGRDAPQGPLREFLICEEALGEPPARWMGGRSPAPRLPSDQQAGGTYFSKCFQPAPLFRILFYFYLFLKKSRGRRPVRAVCCLKPGPGVQDAHGIALLLRAYWVFLLGRDIRTATQLVMMRS
jgi:hypothetical protein